LERYARELGLDMKAFRAALDDGRYRAAVEADFAEGSGLGVRGTPTSFINGSPVVGAQPIEVFRAMIDAKRAEAKQLVAGGVPRAKVYAHAVGLAK
jgi:predicted DsbA family dithiol-disulfide isomerase